MINTSNPLITQNLIYNNSAGQGSGIYWGSQSAVVVSNTIVAAGGSTGTAVYRVRSCRRFPRRRSPEREARVE